MEQRDTWKLLSELRFDSVLGQAIVKGLNLNNVMSETVFLLKQALMRWIWILKQFKQKKTKTQEQPRLTRRQRSQKEAETRPFIHFVSCLWIQFSKY